MSNVFHKRVNDINKKIPRLFMNTKFQKRPSKYRFTAGASKAIAKELAIGVNSCLKLLKMCIKVIVNKFSIEHGWLLLKCW